MKTNKQKYKDTFASLTCIEPIKVEEKTMKKQHKISLAFAMSVLVLVLSGGTICYANDVGGIRTIVTSWFEGKQTQIEAVDDGDLGYNFYKDNEDEPFMGGGGVAFENGKEVKLSAEDVLEANARYVDKKEDGTIMLYDHDLALDITNYIKDGQAKLIVSREGEDVYWNIEVDDNSVSVETNPNKPLDADQYVRVQ